MNLQSFPSVALQTSYKGQHHNLSGTCFWACEKHTLIPLLLEQSKYIKMQLKEIPSIGYSVFEFFSTNLPLCKDYSCNFHKKFRATTTNVTDVEYKIQSFCFYLFIYFLSFAENTHIHRTTAKILTSGFRGPHNIQQQHKIGALEYD